MKIDGDIPPHSKPDKEWFYLRAKEMDLESGWLGRYFGTGKNASLNIAGLLVALLVGSGVLVLFVPGDMSAVEYWNTIVPLLTLVMGYVFGKSSKDG